MEGPNRTAGADLILKFQQSPFAFDFFRAVRLLETGQPTHGRIGKSHDPREDPIRFGQSPSLAFAPSTLESVRPGEGGQPGKMLVRFFGLFGPSGPLPLHLTEHAHDQLLQWKDSTFVDFCDVFHHRLLSLFYRAWAVNQKSVDFDRAGETLTRSFRSENWSGPRFALYIGSLFGLGMESLREKDEISDWAKLFFSGRLACQTRNAEGLGAIVQEYFGMPTEIQSFFGQWLELPSSSLCKLGETPETCSLGLTTIVGSRFWDCQLKFRIRLGPMKLAELQRFLPIGKSFGQLKCWVMNYVAEELFWDVQLVLKSAEVPQIALGQAGLLGWTTWLKSLSFVHDADDLILNPQ
ncbi:MAG TPA: type VI secretion system baseplate subunit TssG [Terrimicrobiaceae bacterium]